MDANLICFDCKHLDKDGFGCKAFPNGIPMEITDQGKPHDHPLDEQTNEIVFEKKDKD